MPTCLIDFFIAVDTIIIWKIKMTMMKIMMKMVMMMMTMTCKEVESGDRIRPLRGRFGRPPLHTLLSICALPLKSHSLEFISGDLVVSVNWLLSPCIHLYGFLRHHLRRILKTKFSSIWQHSEQMKYKTYQRKKNASLIFRSASTSCTNLVPPARPSIQKKI